MSRDAGHFENPGVLARLKSNAANVGGGDWHRGTPVMTADAWPSPSQVGEHEVALDEVMRGSSGRAWRCRGAREECSEPSPAMGALVQASARTGRASRGRALDAKRTLLQRHI
jgi:hypothetical protein